MAAEADAALVARLLAETGAARTAEAPGWQEYLRDLAFAFAEWLEAALAPVARRLGGRLDWLVYAAVGVVIVTVSLLLFFLGRSLVQALRARRAPAPAAGPAGPVVIARVEGPAFWRAEIEARLARGDVAAALAGLWWWLASALIARDVDATWTSRELLEHARRRDLLPLAHALDRHVYGPRRPAAAEVRLLVERFEGALR